MKFLKSFLIILVPLALALGWAVGAFGCGFSGGHDFGCRIVAPSFGFAAIATLISGIMVITQIVKKKSASQDVSASSGVVPAESHDLSHHKTAKIVFAVAIAIPLLLLALVSYFPESKKAAYLEGYTAKACSSGYPSVPWGDHIDKNQCYAKLGMCDKLTDSDLQVTCYFDNRGKIRRDKIAEESKCSVLIDPYRRYSCKRQFAGDRGDWKYCETIKESSPNVSRDLRNSCFTEVAEADKTQVYWPANDPGFENNLQFLAIRHKNSPTLCDNFTGIKKDSCFYWMTMYSTDNSQYCALMTTSQVYKQDCEDMDLDIR